MRPVRHAPEAHAFTRTEGPMRPTRLLLGGAALLTAACTDRSMPVAPTSVGDSPLANVTSKTSSDLSCASDMLLQRAVTDHGPCANRSLRTTVVRSVLDLVSWVTT